MLEDRTVMSSLFTPKSVWTNKFDAPKVARLRDAYAPPLIPVFEAARELLTKLEGVDEQVAWQGLPWRWTVVYTGPGGEGTDLGSGRAFAYLIPDPAKLQICIPLTHAQVALMPLRKFKKAVRDGITFARAVNGVCWPTWDLPTKVAVDEVAEVIKRKHRILTSAPDAIAVEA